MEVCITVVMKNKYFMIKRFVRANFESELADNKWVRFIFNGQDLRDDARTLQACNVGDNCTMHCLITTQARPAPSHVSYRSFFVVENHVFSEEKNFCFCFVFLWKQRVLLELMYI